MQHGTKWSLRDLLLEDTAAIVVGVAGVDDERQAGYAGGRDMRAETARPRFRRAVVVEIVEPRLPQRYDLRMLGKLDQFGRRNPVLLVGVVRMGADRAIDVWKALGDCDQFT